jgi:hypothetical protein
MRVSLRSKSVRTLAVESSQGKATQPREVQEAVLRLAAANKTLLRKAETSSSLITDHKVAFSAEALATLKENSFGGSEQIPNLDKMKS